MSALPRPDAAGDTRAEPPAPVPAAMPSHELIAELRARCTGRVAIMGIGNPARGDDAVGSIVARKLRRAFAWVPPDQVADDVATTTVAIVDAEEIPESHLDVLAAARPTVVVLVDAADLGAAPGSLTLVDAAHLGDCTTFTHRTPLAPLARFIERRTGATVLLAAIQPASPGWGSALTGEVEDTANRLANILWDALRPPAAEAPGAVLTPEAPVW